MAIILQKEAPVLRAKAKAVPVAEIKSAKIQKVIASMKEALKKEYDGVGIAAPQIGESLRIFVVSDMVFKARRKNAPVKAAEIAAEVGAEIKPAKPLAKDQLVYINPEILSTSKDQKSLEEGCLSVRPLFGKVKRASRARIRAYDENGQLFERGSSGLLAQIYQHEVDHLEGVLFIDKAKDIREMPPYVAEDGRHVIEQALEDEAQTNE